MTITLEYGCYKDEYNLDPKVVGWDEIYYTLNMFTKNGYISSEEAKKILMVIKLKDIDKDFV